MIGAAGAGHRRRRHPLPDQRVSRRSRQLPTRLGRRRRPHRGRRPGADLRRPGGRRPTPSAPGLAEPPWTADEVRAALPAGSGSSSSGRARPPSGPHGRLRHGRRGLRRRPHDPIRDGAFSVARAGCPPPTARWRSARRSRGGASRSATASSSPGTTSRSTVVGVLTFPSGTRRSRSSSLPPGRPPSCSRPELDVLRSTSRPGWTGRRVQELNAAGLAVVSRDVVPIRRRAATYLPPGYAAGSASAGDPPGSPWSRSSWPRSCSRSCCWPGRRSPSGCGGSAGTWRCIAASGGTPADLRRVVLASGLVLGGGAAVLGALLGVGLARLAVPVIEDRTTRALGPFEVPLLDVAGGGARRCPRRPAAAYVPARQAARTDVVDHADRTPGAGAHLVAAARPGAA